jgi:hypothetical protein
MTQETNNLAADLWALADLLRGDFRQSQYGRVILPFALLRRLECVLESSKSSVLAEAAKVEKMAIAAQLGKADPNATHKDSRTFGTLGVLRHELRDRNARLSLCQFKPEHDLNPDTLARYAKNRLRVVPELVYSPWATDAHLLETGTKAKAWRIDLVLFVNGVPVATLELKSEFKQAVDRAIRQYKTTRLPVDPAAKKAEPLLTFKRGALVHFAVSQYEVHMATRLEGGGQRNGAATGRERGRGCGRSRARWLEK